VPRSILRSTSRQIALITALVVSVSTFAFAFVAPANSALPNTDPTLRLNRTIRTSPFSGLNLSMLDSEGSAYVPRDNSLWLADDNGRKLFEVNASTGVLKRVVKHKAFMATRQLGGGPLAGLSRDRDLEALAYDATTDTMYAFAGNKAGTPAISSVFRLSRTSGDLQLDSFQPLPTGTDFTAAAWRPNDGKVYVAKNRSFRTYNYNTNTSSAIFQVPNLDEVLGMTFSPNGADLYVVRSQARLGRVNWAAKSLVPSWNINLAPFGVRDSRAVELINDKLWVADGDDLRAPTDPLDHAVFVFDVLGASGAPKASFTASRRSGKAPFTVRFSDTSSGSPESRVWTFGDGQRSTATNPSHVYRKAGTYFVTLTASKPGSGSSTATKQITARTVRAATKWTALKASKGYPTKLRATLRNARTGHALGNQPVIAQVKPYHTRTWQTIGAASTARSGVATFRHKTTRAGQFRFSYARTLAHSGSISKAVFVKVPTRLSAAAKTGRPDVVRGTLRKASGTGIGGERVKLQRRYAGQRRWVTVDAVTSSRSGKVASRQQAARTADYRWAYNGSATNRSARSHIVRVKN